MTTRTVTVIDVDGELAAPYTPTVSDAYNVADLPAILEVSNGSGSSINVTLVDGSTTPNGTAAAALTPVAVAAGAKRRFKLLPSYAGSSSQQVVVNISAITSVTCDYFRI